MLFFRLHGRNGEIVQDSTQLKRARTNAKAQSSSTLSIHSPLVMKHESPPEHFSPSLTPPPSPKPDETSCVFPPEAATPQGNDSITANLQEDDISDAIDAAFDDMSSPTEGDSDQDSGSDSEAEQAVPLHTTDNRSTSIVRPTPAAPLPIVAGSSEALSGWKEIVIKRDKRHGPHVQSVMDQLEKDTVHSVSNAIASAPSTAVANALIRRIEAFARRNTNLWDAIQARDGTSSDDVDNAMHNMAPLIDQIDLIASFVQSMAVHVRGGKGLDCYRHIVFSLQFCALAVRRVCGASKAPLDIQQEMMLGSTYSVRGLGHSKEDMTREEEDIALDCVEDDADHTVAEDVLPETPPCDDGKDSTNGRSRSGSENSLSDSEQSGDDEMDGDDITEDRLPQGDVGEEDSNGDSSVTLHRGIDNAASSTGIENGDHTLIDDGNASNGVTRPLTKAARQIVSCIASAVVVRTAFNMVIIRCL